MKEISFCKQHQHSTLFHFLFIVVETIQKWCWLTVQQRTNSKLSGSSATASSLDQVLQKHRVERQAYHGKAFVGNHINKLCKVNVQVLHVFISQCTKHVGIVAPLLSYMYMYLVHFVRLSKQNLTHCFFFFFVLNFIVLYMYFRLVAGKKYRATSSLLHHLLQVVFSTVAHIIYYFKII